MMNSTKKILYWGIESFAQTRKPAIDMHSMKPTPAGDVTVTLWFRNYAYPLPWAYPTKSLHALCDAERAREKENIRRHAE
jgi:hypothetical protein